MCTHSRVIGNYPCAAPLRREGEEGARLLGPLSRITNGRSLAAKMKSDGDGAEEETGGGGGGGGGRGSTRVSRDGKKARKAEGGK